MQIRDLGGKKFGSGMEKKSRIRVRDKHPQSAIQKKTCVADPDLRSYLTHFSGTGQKLDPTFSKSAEIIPGRYKLVDYIHYLLINDFLA